MLKAADLKSLPTHFVTGFVFFVTFHFPLLAQSVNCPPVQTLLPANDTAYTDAMDLSKRLEDYGFVVHCIFSTKFGSIFRIIEGGIERSTIEGEADFRTNYGDIDVVFVPKPQTFSDFKITERRQGGGYLYRFGGTPRVWAVNRFGTARRQTFLRHDNQLLLVGEDAALRARLEEALHLRPQIP